MKLSHQPCRPLRSPPPPSPPGCSPRPARPARPTAAGSAVTDSGACSQRGTFELSAKHGRQQHRGRVRGRHQPGRPDLQRVRLTDNGDVIAHRTVKTHAPSGSFSINKLAAEQDRHRQDPGPRRPRRQRLPRRRQPVVRALSAPAATLQPWPTTSFGAAGPARRSFARASEHLRSIMTRAAAERRAAGHRAAGPAVLNIATVTARGEPRLSAVDGHFLHGRWYFTTAGDSPKAPPAGGPAGDQRGLHPARRVRRLLPRPGGRPSTGAEREMLREHCVQMYGVARRFGDASPTSASSGLDGRIRHDRRGDGRDRGRRADAAAGARPAAPRDLGQSRRHDLAAARVRRAPPRRPPTHLADLDRRPPRRGRELGLPAFRADQLSRHYFGPLRERPGGDDRSPAGRPRAARRGPAPAVADRGPHLEADAGTTRKTLWRLHDGALVESVLMRYPGPRSRSASPARPAAAWPARSAPPARAA